MVRRVHYFIRDTESLKKGIRWGMVGDVEEEEEGDEDL